MNRSTYAAALLLASAAAAAAPLRAQAADPARLAALYDRHDCFTARDALKTAPAGASGDLAFYRGWVSVAFNQPAQAAGELRAYLASPAARVDEKHRRAAEQLLADVLVREFQYGEAADAYARVAAATTDSTRGDMANNATLFAALRAVPAQTVAFAADVDVPLTRDRAGLMNVGVEAAAGLRQDFVFDTGANLSTVGESVAAELGFRIVDQPVQVGTATGGRASARLAVAPELRIGGATVRNVVFLVLADSALSFPQIGYRIRGIVGHPVIAALGEVTLTRDGHLRAAARPAAVPAGAEPNLCLDGLDNLVRGEVGGQPLLLGLDTGAASTQLFPPYHRQNRAAVEAGRATTLRIGGAAGMRTLQAYAIGPVALTVGGATATLPQVSVSTEPSGARSDYADGDVGQDVITRFAEMTLDYRAMQLRFR